jgi:hypothetical protein
MIQYRAVPYASPPYTRGLILEYRGLRSPHPAVDAIGYHRQNLVLCLPSEDPDPRLTQTRHTRHSWAD